MSKFDTIRYISNFVTIRNLTEKETDRQTNRQAAVLNCANNKKRERSRQIIFFFKEKERKIERKNDRSNQQKNERTNERSQRK